MNIQKGEALLARAKFHWSEGQHDEAERICKRLAEKLPKFIDGHFFLGTYLCELGRFEEGVAALRRAEQLAPKSSQIKINLATAYQFLGNIEKATETFQHVYATGQRTPELLNNLGLLYRRLGRLSESLNVLQELAGRYPNFPIGHVSLGTTLLSVGDVVEASISFQDAMRLSPEDGRFISAFLATSMYRSDLSAQKVAAIHCGYSKVFEKDLEQNANVERAGLVTDRTIHDPPRLGFVSPDFGNHSVSYFLVPLLRQLKASGVPVYLYSCLDRVDRVASAFKQGNYGIWADISDLSDELAQERIRGDDIDVLFELAGHTVSSRLSLFAERMASVSVSYLGYPGTTGLPGIDYAFSDATLDPPSSELLYSEQLIRLPFFSVYSPPEEAAGREVRSIAPLQKSGHLTLGVFHGGQKMTPENITLWTSLLARVDKSRLLVMVRGSRDPLFRSRWQAAASKNCVEMERIEFVEYGRLETYFDMLERVDICLDALPWNGHTITCHAMWMGVPTLTWKGDRRAARMGEALMAAVELQQFVATDIESACVLLCKYLDAPEALSRIGASMRGRMRSSKLMDYEAYSSEFMAAVRVCLASRRSAA